jgi:hypothetical protein
MFGRKAKHESILDTTIAAVLAEMAEYGPMSPEYPKMLKLLERLNKVKTKSSRRPVSTDTIVLVLGAVAQVVIIVAYESRHVMVSKGMSFIIKPK